MLTIGGLSWLNRIDIVVMDTYVAIVSQLYMVAISLILNTWTYVLQLKCGIIVIVLHLCCNVYAVVLTLLSLSYMLQLCCNCTELSVVIENHVVAIVVAIATQ